MSEQQTNELLRWVAERAIDYREKLPSRNVAPTAEAIERLKEFDVSLQDDSIDAGEVIKGFGRNRLTRDRGDDRRQIFRFRHRRAASGGARRELVG